MSNNGYRCESCEGTVREKILPREVFRHAKGFVILEGAPDSLELIYRVVSLRAWLIS